MGVSIIAARNHKFPPEPPAIGFHEISLQRPLRMRKMVHYNAPGAYIYQTIFPVNEQTRRATDGKPFEGVERRRNPGIAMDIPEGNEVNVFHELGKALLLMDQDKRELYFQIATGKGAEALKDVRIKVGQGLAGWVAETGEIVVCPTPARTRVSSKKSTNGRKWKHAPSWPFPSASASNAWA